MSYNDTKNLLKLHFRNMLMLTLKIYVKNINPYKQY